MKLRVLFILQFFIIKTLFSQFSMNNVFVQNDFKYNFFTGKGPVNLSTTVRGFGSGVMDFSGRYGYGFWLMKKKNLLLGIGSYAKIDKYKFEENLIFNTSNYEIMVDTNVNHSYVHDFFSRTHSKLALFKYDLPFVVYVPFGNLFKKDVDYISTSFSFFYDFLFFSYNKLIYFENNQLVKLKFSNLKNFFNTQNLGVGFSLKIGPIRFFYERALFRLFKEQRYNYYENSAGFTIDVDFDSKEKFKKDKKTEKGNFEL